MYCSFDRVYSDNGVYIGTPSCVYTSDQCLTHCYNDTQNYKMMRHCQLVHIVCSKSVLLSNSVLFSVFVSISYQRCSSKLIWFTVFMSNTKQSIKRFRKQ